MRIREGALTGQFLNLGMENTFLLKHVRKNKEQL